MKTTDKKQSNFVFILLVIAASFYARLAVSMYTPALPAIAKEFHTSIGLTQMTVMIFLFCVGIFQPIYGSLSDAIGRRKVLLTGTFIFIIGTACAVFSSSIDMLILSRVLQGIGAAACPVMIKAMFCDRFKEKKQLRFAFSLFVTTGTVLVAVAPAVGGFIQEFSSWRVIFAVLGIVAIII